MYFVCVISLCAHICIVFVDLLGHRDAVVQYFWFCSNAPFQVCRVDLICPFYVCRVDCGVFMIKFMECWRNGFKMIDLFTQQDIPSIRVKILNDLVYSKHNIADINAVNDFIAQVSFLHFLFLFNVSVHCSSQSSNYFFSSELLMFLAFFLLHFFAQGVPRD